MKMKKNFQFQSEVRVKITFGKSKNILGITKVETFFIYLYVLLSNVISHSFVPEMSYPFKDWKYFEKISKSDITRPKVQWKDFKNNGTT
jgi:hypothetical protein